MDISFKLLDFNVYNEEDDSASSSSGDDNIYKVQKDNKNFMIQMFGIDEKGDDYSILIEEFRPFFYMEVSDNWSITTKIQFLDHIKQKIGAKFKDSIVDCKIIKRERLYGFDNHKEYKFIFMRFKNTIAMNRVKNLFYMEKYDKDDPSIKEWKLKPNGYRFKNTNMRLYETNIPPLLRYFHIKDISPSGWVSINKKHLKKSFDTNTNCKYEYTVNYRNVIPLKNKETHVPYKICSFDIEASSSHGDFPLAVKNYKKLTTDILDYWDQNSDTIKEEYTRKMQENLIKNAILTAFGYSDIMASEINTVYPIVKPNKEQIDLAIDKILKNSFSNTKKNVDQTTISNILNNLNDDENSDGEFTITKKNKIKGNNKIVDILTNSKFKREEKLNEITVIFDALLPKLHGDKVTFIGSTFIKYGEDEPYLNHCIALDTCSDVENAEIERYNTEKDVLLAWKSLIQRENPDIVIGYNIFGFDYKFMYQRAKENGGDCLEEFLKLSRNKDEICGKDDGQGSYKIEETNTKIASGSHDMYFIKMNGRINVDLYNYFRREYNLTSYKLDYVSGYFIGDKIKKLEHDDNITTIYSKNLMGLKDHSYIQIEEIGHSTEFYDKGSKFMVYDVDDISGTFKINNKISPDTKKILKWCLAKDDVSPQDIFRMTNEGPEQRAIIAKYCIQDCNLVHHLLKKIDVITGITEMANICSVPIDFIVMRGQGIKLFSFIAKKCREARTLIPVLEKKDDGGYEGAIVLPPKCGLYLDEPVACVDYSSLYPSSMISENLSHDSKVWSLEYDLDGNLVNETGVKDDESGEYVYDNLPGYEYVDIEYDTYEYRRKTPKSAAIKTKVGYKKCRFAQFKDGELAIMPRILKELLAARKATRSSAKWKTIITNDKEFTGLVIEKTDDFIVLKDKDGNIENINTQNITEIKDTYNDFMKNVLDKRQLAIKVTANSLYGQCGARTSSFYEKDVAASTTAIGRKLLTYGQRIIEEVYGDRLCTTKYGTVKSNAEYIYGDTDSVFMSFKLTHPETGEKIVGKEALKHTIELAKEAGELATMFLKPPHDLEYEKTFMPFCLLSKKRYVGMLYEEDPDVCFRKSMGIVLKRRDNAPIVKDVYGGIIDILMKDKDVSKAIEFTQKCLNNIVNEKYPLDKLIITKSLRGFYKNPLQIAHKVLADRMGKRDPGNKPSSGDRIPFVYIQKKTKSKLQGDRIEHPDYIIKNKLKPDFSHYITNQIMKPVQQVFALVLQDIPEFKKNRQNITNLKRTEREYKRKYKNDEIKQQKYIQDYRNKEVKNLIFSDSLRKCELSKNNQQSILSFLK
tara:strand:+ start:3174 stop:7106 length:3933 start_codon:yes stop_codon:yes gene_type:complete